MKKDIRLLIESIFGSGDDLFDDNFSITNLIVDYVDLGLPSGTLWCKYNVGAKKETDYGNYYQWGETKDNVIEYTGFRYEKYNNEDGLTLLLPEDDIAYQTSKGLYRIPTNEQWEELIKYTDNEWVDDFHDSGVNGYIFRSKENDNYIFIPAAGYHDSSCLVNQSLFGYVLSSNLFISSSYYLRFDSSSILSFCGLRRAGNSVRGVLNKND